MRRLTLLISGNVQKAGYRDLVIRFGTALGLTGYAENLPDGRVKVAAEGAEQKLELLKVSVNIRDALINVEKIEGSFSEATGEFSYFYKLVKEGETDERLDKAAELLKEMIGSMNYGFSVLNNTMISGFNRLGEGQDKILEKLQEVIQDTSAIKSTLSMIETDIRDKNFSLSSFIEQKFQQQEMEIAEIKITLSRMQEAQDAPEAQEA